MKVMPVGMAAVAFLLVLPSGSAAILEALDLDQIITQDRKQLTFYQCSDRLLPKLSSFSLIAFHQKSIFSHW